MASAPCRGRACCTTSSAARARASRPFGKDDYRADIDQVMLFLEGRQEQVAKRLREEMTGHRRRPTTSARPTCATSCAPSSARWRARRWPPSPGPSSTSWATRGRAAARRQLFAIRDGTTVARDVFLLENVGDSTDDEALSAFIKQYYAAASSIPPRVLVPRSRARRFADLVAYLEARRGHKGRARRVRSAASAGR